MSVLISLLLIILGLLITGIYKLHTYISKQHEYWNSRGVYTPKPKPIVGHFLDIILFRKTLAELLKEYYDAIDKPFFGLYIFDEPFLFVKDPVLAKNILIKEFASFTDRNVAAPKHNPVFQNFMFNQKSPAWKHDRSKLSPIFSPAKLKEMFPIIHNSGVKFMDFIRKHEGVIDAKVFSSRYSTDIISQCVFGLDTHNYEKEMSIFQKSGHKCFDFSMRNAFSQTIHILKPGWAEKLKLDFMPMDACNFICSVFLKTMRNRREDERRNDLLDMLNDMNKKNLFGKDSENQISGIAIQFFLAAYETTASTIAFALYSFAKDVNIQNRLREEIKAAIAKHGSITYETVMDIPYLEMCVNETLRIFPILPFYERKCNKEYPIPNTNVVIEEGNTVLMSSYGLHMDEKFFPNPTVFDPERFREKIDQTNGIVYMPFGEGPRKCLGDRFGLLSVKLGVLLAVLHFEVSCCDQTPDLIEFEPLSFVLQSKVGVPLRFKSIN